MMPAVAAEASATQINLVTDFLSELRNRGEVTLHCFPASFQNVRSSSSVIR